MAIIYTYPIKATPILADTVIITDTESEDPENRTKLASIASIKNTINVVDSFNSLKGDVTITGGTNITLNPSSNNIEINSTGTTYTAGNGLDLTGTVFSTDLKPNGGLVIELTELAIDLAASSITGTLKPVDGGTGASISSTSVHNILVGDGGSAYGESKDVETGIQLAVGTTNRRPGAGATNVGLIRYNSETTNFEVCKETSESSGEYSWYTINVTG